jgi:ligand-binding sensor domain-containing protein
MRFCRTFLLLFFALSSAAQQLSFFKPDNLKQLPSSECYNIIQDSRGYIWFSTEGGLCRYNGSSVRVFGPANGLPESATYNLAEDKNGKLWMTTSRNRILYFDRVKDSLREIPISKTYAARCNKILQQTYTMLLESDSALWLNTQQTTYRVNLRTNTIETHTVPDTGYFNFYGNPWGLVSYKRPVPIAYRTQVMHTQKLHLVMHDKEARLLTIPYSKNYSPESRVLTAKGKQGEYYIGFGHIFIRINPDGSYQSIEFTHQIICIYVDKSNGLWVGFYKDGMRYFPDANPYSGAISSMPDLSVSGVCEDAEEGIWCTTLEKGVFYCRNKYVLNYANVPGLEKRAEFLKVINNHLYTASEKKEIIEIYEDSIRKRLFASEPIPTDIIRYGDTIVISSKGQLFKSDTSLRKNVTLVSAPFNLLMGANRLAVTPDKRVFAMNWTSLEEVIGLKYMDRVERFESRTHAILATHGGRLLVGCTEGLFEVDLQNFSTHRITGLIGSVTGILETKSDGIWVTTKEHGLYVLEKKRAKKISNLLRLPTERFNDIAQDPQGGLWVASNIGLIHLGKPFSKQNTSIYNALSGLNSTEVLQVAATSERIFVSTYEGLCSFPLRFDLSNTAPPVIYVRHVKVNENLVDLTAKSAFAWDENNVKITYDVLTFRRAGLPTKLLYRVDGLDNKTHYTEGRELSLNSLPPGTYKVMMYALNNDGKPSLAPAVVEFTIKKPFWFTPIFIIASIATLIALIFLIVNRIIFRIQQKEEEKTRVNKLLAEYQMSALRAQMNPHFIFNCINSIQRYILTNKAEEAYNYLVKFSRLIRLVLNYSDENLISLAQELEIVELYIELEQLRFENKFTYRIEMSENINVNELIVPVMIMQPYIENAIWHGLMNLDKGKAGHIYIRLSFDDHLLHVIIEDNGIGIERSSRLKKSEHRSKSTQINSKRADILNIISSRTKGSVVIENIERNGVVEGTRVIINIPQNSNL